MHRPFHLLFFPCTSPGKLFAWTSASKQHYGSESFLNDSQSPEEGSMENYRNIVYSNPSPIVVSPTANFKSPRLSICIHFNQRRHLFLCICGLQVCRRVKYRWFPQICWRQSCSGFRNQFHSLEIAIEVRRFVAPICNIIFKWSITYVLCLVMKLEHSYWWVLTAGT
jgi:hypothetical protein